MVARNTLLTAPPYPVEKALKRLGSNLRTARVRRGLTLEETAQKIGTGVRPVSEAEKGNPSTSIAVYVALLWVFDLMSDFDLLADISRDTEGQTRALLKERSRVRKKGGLSSDF